MLLLTISIADATVCAQGVTTSPAAPVVNLTAPTNDNFVDAAVIDLPVDNIEIDNTQATSEAGEPNHANASGAQHSVWFKWTAQNNFGVSIDVVGNLDSTLAVYTGNSVNALVPVAANNNVGAGLVNRYSRVTFAAAVGKTYFIAVAGANGATGSTYFYMDVNTAESGKIADFDGNTRSDLLVFRPSNNYWYLNTDPNSTGGESYLSWGMTGDILLTGDYSGDGNSSDACVWRPSTGTFYVYNQMTNVYFTQSWGTAGDIPVSGDFDGDDVADFAIWRPSNGTFWVLKSTDGTALVQPWGTGATDVPVPADYDGDGKTDFAVRRQSGPAAGTFFILRSTDNKYEDPVFGYATDLTVPGDFDFDGKADIAVYRPSNNTYYVIASQDKHIIVQTWGMPGDIPVPGDYITNPRTAFSVWRPSTGTLYILDRFDHTYAYNWGTDGDIPVASLRVR
ncbi:MAG: VCBS repeat-containing protein [Pyrinomonadaceae bacterium]